VTHLRQIMLEELRRRNYAESTIHIYIQTVEHFSRHFHRSPYHLDAQKIQALAVKKPCQRSASLLLCDRRL
jgi:integrase/recombinase XerD